MKTFTKNQLLVSKACSKDETRQALQGILIEGNKTIATNGHILMTSENRAVTEVWPVNSVNWKTPESLVPSDNPGSFILPLDAVKKALKAFPKAGKWDTGNTTRLAIGETDTGITIQNANNDKIEAQPIDAKFPDYKQVIPDTTGYIKIGVSASYMKIICEVMEKAEGSNMNGMILHINPNQSKDGRDAIVIENMGNLDEKVTAVLMPLRIQ